MHVLNITDAVISQEMLDGHYEPAVFEPPIIPPTVPALFDLNSFSCVRELIQIYEVGSLEYSAACGWTMKEKQDKGWKENDHENFGNFARMYIFIHIENRSTNLLLGTDKLQRSAWRRNVPKDKNRTYVQEAFYKMSLFKLSLVSTLC